MTVAPGYKIFVLKWLKKRSSDIRFCTNFLICANLAGIKPDSEEYSDICLLSLLMSWM